MSLVKQNVDKVPIEDTVFTIVEKARGAKAIIGTKQVVDAAIGSLYNEEGNVAALNSMFTPCNEIAKEAETTYTASFVDNDSLRKQVYEWTVGSTGSTLVYNVIATPGGTEIIAVIMREILGEGEAITLSEIV